MNQNLAVKESLMTEAEYLAFEEKSKIRHEFMDGEIFAMAGATRRHNLANTNISTELNLQLRETDCEVYANDFRVRIRDGHNVYPDVAVACGDIKVEGNETTLLNPIIVFEVLSKSTEKRDRGDKAEDYFRLSSLKDNSVKTLLRAPAQSTPISARARTAYGLTRVCSVPAERT